MHDQSERIGPFGLPEGLPAALAGALFLLSAFFGFTTALPLSSAERWAALTTFTILACAVTLPGCSAIADALGRTVRRDWRAFATLLAAIPVLFVAYALAVGSCAAVDLLSATLFVVVPAAALWHSRAARQPTLLDAIGLGYLGLVSVFGLWPTLTLPIVGGRVAFFTLALVPLLVILLAARGWPGLGFTWHLSSADLRVSLLGALIGLALVLPNRLAFGAEGVGAMGLLPTFGRAIEAYFYVALPIAVLDRGVVQQGITRALAAHPRLAPLAGITVGALLAGVRMLVANPNAGLVAATSALAAIGYGWVYWRTGKVTAAAVSQMLVIWV